MTVRPRIPEKMLRKLEAARDVASFLPMVKFGTPKDSIVDPETNHRVRLDTYVKRTMAKHHKAHVIPVLDEIIAWAKNLGPSEPEKPKVREPEDA